MPKQEKGLGQGQINAARYLKDISFPCSREEVLEKARENGAGNDVLNIIGQMPDQDYASITEVEMAFTQASRKAA